MGPAEFHRRTVLAVRYGREYHPFSDGRPLSEPVVLCREVRAVIHRCEVGVCAYAAADCIGGARASAAARLVMTCAAAALGQGSAANGARRAA